MTEDWAWRVVFMDGSQFLFRGQPKVVGYHGFVQIIEFESFLPPYNVSDSGHKERTATSDVSLAAMKYLVMEEPPSIDWPDGVYIMRLPDTAAAPPKPEG